MVAFLNPLKSYMATHTETPDSPGGEEGAPFQDPLGKEDSGSSAASVAAPPPGPNWRRRGSVLTTQQGKYMVPEAALTLTLTLIGR